MPPILALAVPPSQTLLRLLPLIFLMIVVLVIAIRAQRLRNLAKRAYKDNDPAARRELYQHVAKMAISRQPDHITLVRHTILWSAPQKYSEWTGVLQQNGFTNAGSYLVKEVSAQVEFWVNSTDDFTACLYEHPKAGMWMDVVTRYEDGNSTTYANKTGTALDQDPRFKAVYLGPVSARELLEKAREDRWSGRKKPSAETVVQEFQDAWTRYIQWRKERGTTAEEVSRIDERRLAARQQPKS